ncbi:MAG: nodulation protein NfeD [Candidatus Eisenbacteria bacterium]|uniref:Nodulation protein NfeD n=1 Tax=Eiseniibacteriota bacterium TaxID=2212470 RepID=A0A538TZP8_UNCEI|nr:MAG: nodulation protein NfeD [Candidatus Eisenbacteria bacterium]
MNPLRVVRCVALALLAVASFASAAPRAPGQGRVLVSRLEGPVSPVMAQALESALDRASASGYEALVLEVDTPGGLETSMRDMVKAVLASPVPVVMWVTPSGARAASAGVFIVMAADVAAMAPATNIGAATPINLQGGMDSTLARKVTNDAAAFARTIAAQRGRNGTWAERAVREAVSASETEAVDLRIVDFIASSLPELLAKADGRAWRRGSEIRSLHLRGLPADRIEPGVRQRLLSLIADPNVAYILMMLGFYGLLFELQNPGAVLPGVVGGICLILAFLAFSVLPVNYAGLALIALAIVFFVAEIKVPTHGVLTAGGVLALVLGSLILFETGGAGPRLSWAVIAGATLATTGFFGFLVAAGIAAQNRRVTTGRQGLIGTQAVAIDGLVPEGRVRVGDELWSAVSEAPVEPGANVEITGMNGLRLSVRPLAKEAHS